MNEYDYTITCTYNYCGYPMAKRKYLVKGEHNGMFMQLELTWLGNYGWDIPKVVKKQECNGYYWELEVFLKAMFGEGLRLLNCMRESETKELIIDISNSKEYKAKWKGENK